jgi:arginyl-tRNA synthetase
VFRNLEQMDERHNVAIGDAAIDRLAEEHELQLMRTLSRYPETIDAAARRRSPHLLAHYLHAVATDLHAYYNAHQFLVEEENLRNARLNLVLATRTVLQKGLALLGVSAPEEM